MEIQQDGQPIVLTFLKYNKTPLPGNSVKVYLTSQCHHRRYRLEPNHRDMVNVMEVPF